MGTSTVTYLHLRAGCTVVPLLPDDGDARMLIAAPHESFAEVAHPDARALEGVLRGAQPCSTDDELTEIAEACVEWGIADLRDDPARRLDPSPLTDSPTVTTLADELARLLPAPTPAVRIADVLDDTRWTEVDAEMRAAGQSWLPLHRELGRLVVGPVLGPADGTVSEITWADVRFRRLAASPAREQLVALWRHWDACGVADDVVPTPEMIDEAVHRLATYLRDPANRDVLRRHQVVTPLEPDAAPTAHPVLPVPTGLMEMV